MVKFSTDWAGPKIEQESPAQIKQRGDYLDRVVSASMDSRPCFVGGYREIMARIRPYAKCWIKHTQQGRV